MEEKYKRYLEIPKLTRPFNKDTPKYNIHDKHWCIFTGRSIIGPHPHRHYTFEEFVERCKIDEELNKI